MKKISKKLLSFLFVFMLLIGTSTTAFASSYSTMGSGMSNEGGGTSCAHHYVPMHRTIGTGSPENPWVNVVVGHMCEFCGSIK